MSFKNDFSSSEVMRSLEKIAQEKGLIKPDPIKKTAAAKKADFTPTSNLMENIFKLCAGLRTQGLEKVAMEVEMNYLNYKQAQTLYETSKEKGEDVIHAAHPDGSHKMENIDSDEATFEDILDKHTKMLQVIEKRPHGKLSSAAQILKAVKVALARASDEDRLRSLVDQVKKIMNFVEAKSNDELTFSITGWVNEIGGLLGSGKPSVFNLNAAKKKVHDLGSRLNPSVLGGATLGMGGLSEYTWGTISAELSKVQGMLSDAIEARKNIDVTENSSRQSGGEEPKPLAVPEVKMTADPVISAGTNLINTLKAYQSVGVVSRNQAALQWIRSEIGQIQNVMQRYNSAESTGQLDAVKSSLQAEMNEKQKEVNDFAAQVKSSA